jgi:DNA-binding response OmpR family regulator
MGGATLEATMRLLVAEDDRKVASFIRQGLEEEGYAVEVAPDGAAALDTLLAGPPFDLVVLDVMLPRQDGFSVLKRMRERRIETPVLFLTARDTVPDRVAGLDLGADDYLTKPFSFDELLARIRALLRRGHGQRSSRLRVTDLTLDPATREVTRGARKVELTVREYALLEFLMRNVGRVQTRSMLTEHVWGLNFDPESNVVDVYVGYLRRKVDGPGEQRLIHTIRGAGYVLRDGV